MNETTNQTQRCPGQQAKTAPTAFARPGKKCRAAVNLFACFGLLAGVGALSFLLPRQTVSLLERRTLAEPPKLSASGLLSGSYTRGVDEYYADHFPARDFLVGFARSLDDLRGFRPGAVKLYEQQAAEEQSAPEPAQPPATSQEPGQQTPEPGPEPAPPPEEETQGAHYTGGTFVYKDTAFTLFGGNKKVAAYYAGVLNGYRDKLGEDVAVYNLVTPTSAEFGLPGRYQNLTGNQKENIDYIYSLLAPGITPVDAYGAIQAHCGEYLYFRTDHHWTGLGAYYAYTAFCQAAGLTPLPLSEMETRSREGFLGTLYSQTQDSLLAQNPDRVDYYVLPTGYTAEIFHKDQPYYPTPLNTLWGEYALPVNSYSIFLHGDWPLMHINTQHKNGRRIVVVKESFGNAFVPFLISHFEDVYVVDQRYFQTSLLELIEQKQVTDLLFLNNIFAANTQYHAQCIGSLAHQVWTPPPPEEEDLQQPDEEPEDDED